MALKFLLLISGFLFIGCNDNSISRIYDQHILYNDIKCMKLVVFPPNKNIENSLNHLYRFDKNCELDFIVSYKDGITCNATQNIDKKAYGMPNSYLRYEIKKNNKLYYSYYIDLDSKISDEDIKDGFDKMQNELNFVEKK